MFIGIILLTLLGSHIHLQKKMYVVIKLILCRFRVNFMCCVNFMLFSCQLYIEYYSVLIQFGFDIVKYDVLEFTQCRNIFTSNREIRIQK